MNKSSARVSLLIKCVPNEAFHAFVDPTKITKFWLSSASAPLSRNSSAQWHFMVPGATDTVTIETFEPPHLLAFRWSDGTQTRIEFAELDRDRTRVSIQFELAADSKLDDVVNTTEGYSIVLCDLKTFLESGSSANLVRSKAELITHDMQRKRFQ